jgi:hypothetical protein
MIEHRKIRTYTKVGKWYNLTYLGIIILSVVSRLLMIVSSANASQYSLEVLRSLTILIVGMIAMFGIVREKPWAKWFAIAVYSLSILIMTYGLVVSFLMDSAFKRFDLISASALLALKIGRVMIITISLLGIFLILKKPPTQKPSGD